MVLNSDNKKLVKKFFNGFKNIVPKRLYEIKPLKNMHKYIIKIYKEKSRRKRNKQTDHTKKVRKINKNK